MELEPCQAKDIDGNMVNAQKAVCPQCHGDRFMILIINGHNHLQCTSCDESFCQGGCAPEKKCRKCNTDLDSNGKCQDITCFHNDHPQGQCSYCGSGLILDGECQKCGL